MIRRDFLLLRTGRGQPLELSGERLYMRSVDAQADVSIDRLFDLLASELEGARTVRLTGVEWLAHGGLDARVERLLAAFVARGGRVIGAQRGEKEAV